jgi:hypothetical protein
VAHTCNPSYSGGRDWEDLDLTPAQANSSRDPILKIPNIKQGWQKDSKIQRLPSKHETLSSSPSNKWFFTGTSRVFLSRFKSCLGEPSSDEHTSSVL